MFLLYSTAIWHVEYGIVHKADDTATKVKVDCKGLMFVVNTDKCFKA